MMDKQQFSIIATGIKSAYPASKILENRVSMDFWYTMLADIPYEVAENAVMEHICTNVFPPNIAEIRKLCMERCKPQALSFDEAWGVVQKAISRHGWNNPDAAFAEMDDLTLSVVKNLGWTGLCHSENQTADRANFREAYEAKAEAMRNKSLLPAVVEKNKALLQKQYVPAVEVRAAPQMEQKEPFQDVRADLTDEQLEERSRKFENMRRRVLGGESKAE